MVRILAAAALVGLLATSAAFAQSKNNNASTTPPAIATGDANSKTSAAPVPGANSFTEGEARSRIEASGYTDVSGLRKDQQSIWRGQAMRNGKQVNVALDYQGNVVSQ